MSKAEFFDRESRRMIAVTPWFHGQQEPARVGVYQREYLTGIFYCHWDGWTWHIGSRQPERVRRDVESPHQCLRWRGLAEEPKEK